MDAIYDIIIDITISIPILGNESIMLIEPPAGFSYKKILFNEYKYKDYLVDGTGEILFDFHFATQGNDENKYIVVLDYTGKKILKHNKPVNSIGFMFGDDLDMIIEPIKNEFEDMLFKYFSMLHLYKEGDFARKYTFYQFCTQEGVCKNNRKAKSICQDIITLILNPMIINKDEVNDINGFIFYHDKAYDILKYVIINDLEYTYHIVDDATNYKNLITPLEVMFLQNEYGNKKEMLAKRIAVFIGNNDNEIALLYDDVKSHYIDRSEAIHEGVISQLTRTRLNELRELLRKITKKYIEVIEKEILRNPSSSFSDIKRKQIKELITVVKMKIKKGVLPINNQKAVSKCFLIRLFQR